MMKCQWMSPSLDDFHVAVLKTKSSPQALFLFCLVPAEKNIVQETSIILANIPWSDQEN